MLPIIKIGVTYTGTDEKHSNYVNWLQARENMWRMEVITLSPGVTKPGTIKNLDGIVLSGGIDMHPRYYNSNKKNYPNAPAVFNERRDGFEVEVFEISRQNHIPVLGVCRGMQLVNCILGGTLTQDIGHAANAIHKFELHDKAHGINITAGTLLNEITGIERGVANSAHHQAIKLLGSGFKVNCTSDDGIIEGVEWMDKEVKPFFMGVQWHPERMYKLNLGRTPLSENLRDRFIKEIKNLL